MLQNFRIVPPKTVDALDIEQIVFFQLPQQFFVLRTVKILAGLLIDIDTLLRNACLPEGDDLTGFVLLSGGNTDIAINPYFYFTPLLLG